MASGRLLGSLGLRLCWPGSLIRHNQDNKLRDKGSAPAQLSTQQPDSNQPHSYTPFNSMLHLMGTGCWLKWCLSQFDYRWTPKHFALESLVSKVIKLGLFAWIVYSVARLSSGLDMFMVALYVNQSQLLCGVCIVWAGYRVMKICPAAVSRRDEAASDWWIGWDPSSHWLTRSSGCIPCSLIVS